jgi:hypothetical protein
MAYAFASASSQYLEASSSPVSTYPLTIAAWVYPLDTTTTGVVASVNTNGGFARQQLVVQAAGTVIQIGSLDSANQGENASASGTYSANVWHHAAGVVSGSSSRVAYMNGNAGTTGTIPVVTTGMNRVMVGARRIAGGTGAYLNGRVADVGIWDVALTADEIASLAKGVPCRLIRPQSLVFYAPLIRDLQDTRGGLSITNNNTATVADHPRIYA